MKIILIPIKMNSTLFSILFSLLLLSCASADSKESTENKGSKTDVNIKVEKVVISEVETKVIETPSKMEDGMYLIKRLGNTKEELEPIANDEKIISFNEEFLDKTDQEAIFLVISTTDFAPLTLKEKPTLTPDKEDRKNLLLSLTEDGKIKLEKFTSDNVTNLTSIVVNGEALTKHKIREAITGGTIQISRCTDNACELLFLELEDNVVEPAK